MLNLNKKKFLLLTFLISLFALISAYFIEYILGYQPCNLCLIERIPYVIALIIITINFKFNHLERYLILLLVFVFLTSTLISLYHLGIEQGFIKESLVCDLKNSSKILSKEEILQQLQQKIVSCKDVTFKILGFSLTTLNIIISLLITIVFTKIYFSYDKN
ncbi:disulfide bond formation protein B [Candidatus Pelagibacter bacterium nBUS_36]|jgi:disulfide bond formation protein DsbB|uniref:disulfide bond formation protein B n=1 Tax=Candidatus Pelagibacter bacterium nBUS_36 TaxID=3374194 RepID=UPI003EBD62B1|tara:strand:+ start:614 stop:1096 length:483 start_codon:yes stop_codon:yes gene_type:complete